MGCGSSKQDKGVESRSVEPAGLDDSGAATAPEPPPRNTQQCPDCKTFWPAAQKFCGDCGGGFSKECPKCKATWPVTQKFCGDCGTGWDTPAAAEQRQSPTSGNGERRSSRTADGPHTPVPGRKSKDPSPAASPAKEDPLFEPAAAAEADKDDEAAMAAFMTEDYAEKPAVPTVVATDFTVIEKKKKKPSMDVDTRDPSIVFPDGEGDGDGDGVHDVFGEDIHAKDTKASSVPDLAPVAEAQANGEQVPVIMTSEDAAAGGCGGDNGGGDEVVDAAALFETLMTMLVEVEEVNEHWRISCSGDNQKPTKGRASIMGHSFEDKRSYEEEDDPRHAAVLMSDEVSGVLRVITELGLSGRLDDHPATPCFLMELVGLKEAILVTAVHLKGGSQHDSALQKHRKTHVTVYNTIRGEQIIDAAPRASMAERQEASSLNMWMDEAQALMYEMDLSLQKLSLEIALVEYETDPLKVEHVLRCLLVSDYSTNSVTTIVPWDLSKVQKVTRRPRMSQVESQTPTLKAFTLRQVGFATIQRRDIPLQTMQAQLHDIFASVTIVRHMVESQASSLGIQNGGSGFLGMQKPAAQTSTIHAKGSQSKAVSFFSNERAKVYPFDLDTLFEERPDCKFPRYISLFGPAGVGKSTYLSRIENQWAQGSGKNMWGGCIELLFRITVRDLAMDPTFYNMSLAEMLFHYHYDEVGDGKSDGKAKLGPEQLHEYLKRSPGKVCVMIDGLEDYQEKCQALKLLLTTSYEYEKEIKVIVVSQPCEKLDALGKYIDTPLEIRGFSAKGVRSYADKFLRESKRMGLKIDMNVVANLVNVITPVVNTDENGVANSMTEIGYLSDLPINLMIMCSLRCLAKKELPNTWLEMCNALFALILGKTRDKNPNLDDGVLDKLGEIALETLLSRRRCVREEDVQAKINPLVLRAGLGILQRRELSNGVAIYEFLPPIFCDYLAARHLTHKHKDNVAGIWQSDENLSTVMLHAAGRLKGAAGPFLAAAAEALAASKSSTWATRPKDGYVLSLLSATHAPELADSISAMCAASGKSTEEVNLEHCEIVYPELDGLNHVLNSPVRITKLALGWNKINDAQMSMLTSGLKETTSLQLLDLTKNNIKPAGAAALAKALVFNTSILDLRLSWNFIGDDGSLFLAEVLADANTTLQNLRLKNNDIGPMGARYLADMLKKNKGLKNLILWQNNVGNEGCAYISESLRTNTTLTQLNLRANRIEVDFEDEICGVTADRENWELKIAD